MASDAWTIRRLLEWTTPFFTRKDVDSPRTSAELLLAHVLALPRIKLYTDFDRALTAEELLQYRELVRRAGEQEPVAYLTGRAHFFNLELEVSRQVLIPRPDTEVLVENLIRLIRARDDWQPPRVLDLCTGSGCVAAAIASGLKTAQIHAVDISPAAIEIAGRNLSRLSLAGRVVCHEGDLYGALAGAGAEQPFHAIVANPPYILTAQIQSLDRSVRDYEPMLALDGGPDGLAFHRRIWAGAAGRLAPGGHVLLEIAFDQGAAALAAIAEFESLTEPRILKDYAGHDRVIAAGRK